MAKIPFDIKFRPQIESGEYKVETRDGSPARVVCWDANSYTPIVFLVTEHDDLNDKDKEYTYSCNNFGRSISVESPKDLFIITPEPELTEFEKSLWEIMKSEGSPIGPFEKFTDDDKRAFRTYSDQLLALAREQFIKDGYVIEKKAFHDAVEKIDDEAEMSLEYSLHCKVENGTRHAVMSWEEFQKVTQHFINRGKAEALKEFEEKYKQSWFNEGKIAGRYEGLSEDEKYQQGVHDGKEEALKDLPRWKPAASCYDGDRLPRIDWMLNRLVARFEEGIYYLDIKELYKLPGFKED